MVLFIPKTHFYNGHINENGFITYEKSQNASILKSVVNHSTEKLKVRHFNSGC